MAMHLREGLKEVQELSRHLLATSNDTRIETPQLGPEALRRSINVSRLKAN